MSRKAVSFSSDVCELVGIAERSTTAENMVAYATDEQLAPSAERCHAAGSPPSRCADMARAGGASPPRQDDDSEHVRQPDSTTPAPFSREIRSASYYNACRLRPVRPQTIGIVDEHSQSGSTSTTTIESKSATAAAATTATTSADSSHDQARRLRLMTGHRISGTAVPASVALHQDSTVSSFDLRDPQPGDEFRNPPSERHYAPKRVQRQSLSAAAAATGQGYKQWFACRRRSSGHAHGKQPKAPTVARLLRHLRTRFRRKQRVPAARSHRGNKAKGHRRSMASASYEDSDRRPSESTSLTKSGICSECASVVPYTAHRAAIAGHMNCLKICVRRGCKQISRSGDSLLHVAAKYGQPECLEWILSNCPSLKILDGNGKGNTVLHCAMDGGDTDCVHMLFVRISGRETPLVSDALDNAMYKANEAGMSPLLVAVTNGRTELVRWLLGVFNTRVPGPMNNTVGGATVFHYAAALGSVEILTLLHQCLPSLAGLGVPKTGKLPIHLAVHTGHLEAAKFLYKVTKNGVLTKSVDGMNCFHQAVQNGHLQCLEWMMKQMLVEEQNMTDCLSQVDEERASLFHFAAAFGETKCMQYLLQCLPDRSFAANARDMWGRTPLHDAAEKNHLNCLKLLLASGADIYARDERGATPYELAMQHDKLRGYIAEHMQASPPQKVPRKPSPEKVQGASKNAFARGGGGDDGHRGSVRYKQCPPRPTILPASDSSKSTTAPEHTYAAVVLSTTSSAADQADETQGADGSALASPTDTGPARGDIDSPDAVIGDRTLSPDGVFCSDDAPSSPLLSPTGAGAGGEVGGGGSQRSVSVGGGLDEAGYAAPAPEDQPSVKIIHAGTSDSRVSHEVSKLSFAMGMFNVGVSVVRVKRETLGAAKVRSPAELIEWLGAESESCDATLLVCTSQLLELLDCAARGGPGAKKKKHQATVATPTFSLPASLLARILPVVTLHGASSRYRPPWLAPTQCYYWPKNQPALFAKLGIQLPEQTLSLPTRRTRAGTM